MGRIHPGRAEEADYPMPSFNLIDVPWIPCAPLGGGAPALLGVRDVLLTADQQRELMDASPLIIAALHRLLFAVVHRALGGPRTAEDWRALWDQRRFDAVDTRRIEDYLERWRSRFDLFGAERPFYQVPRMEEVNAVLAAKLAHEKASGNNITLFDHTTPMTGGLTPAQAARYLVTFQAFAGSGGVSQPFNLSDGPLARDYTVLMRGETLFETLLLNLVCYTEETPIAWLRDDDPPNWEREEPREPRKEGTSPDGYLDYLTWQSRLVHLIYDEATGLVRECQIRQNLKVATGVRDPFKAYRMSKEYGEYSLRLSEERAVWRDSHALLEAAADANEANAWRPAVFDWLAGALPSGIGRQRGHARQYAFDVLGYLNDGARATIILWRHDQLPLPARYLTDKALRDKLRGGLSLAEDVSRLFKADYGGSGQKRYARPMRVLAGELLTGVTERQADKGDIDELVEHFGAERAYWAALEPRFRRFMVMLAERADESGEEGEREALGEWLGDVARCARDTFHVAIRSLDESARALRAAALAERAFNWQLSDLLGVYRERNVAPAQVGQEAHT